MRFCFVVGWWFAALSLLISFGTSVVWAQSALAAIPAANHARDWRDVYGFRPTDVIQKALKARPAYLQPVTLSTPLGAPSDHEVHLGFLAIALDHIPEYNDGDHTDKSIRLATDIRRNMPVFFDDEAVTLRGYGAKRQDDLLSNKPLAGWDRGNTGALLEMVYTDLGSSADHGIVALIEHTPRTWMIGAVDEGVLGSYLNVIAGYTKFGLYRDGPTNVFVVRFAARYLDWLVDDVMLYQYHRDVWNAFAEQVITWLKEKMNIKATMRVPVYMQATVGDLHAYLKE